MRIKPVFVTGAATAVALAAMAIVVFSTAPQQASPTLLGFLWGGIFLAAWGILATAVLLLRQTIVRAVWVALPPAIAAAGLLMALHWGVLTKQLLGGVLFATLVVCVIVWRRLNERP